MFYVTLHVSFKDAGANADLVELCLLGHEVMKYPLLAEFDEFGPAVYLIKAEKTQIQKNIIQATLNAHPSSHTLTMEREREGWKI